MNIPLFFRQLAEKYNTEERCGFCWSFKKVKGEDGLNSIRLTDEDKCCIQLIISYEKKNYSERWNSITTAVNQQYCDSHFTLYAVKSSELGTNFGNEIPGHEYSESISETIIQPLFDCLTCENVLELCDWGIVQWSAEEVLFLGDQNFSGIKINGIFRQNIG